MDQLTYQKYITSSEIKKLWARVFIFISIISILMYIVLKLFPWQSSSDLHTLLESSTTILALLAGALAMVRYYSKKEIIYVFVGIGFVGAGALDGYHAIVTSSYFKSYMPSELTTLIPWSWLASREYLSLVMLALVLAVQPALREKAIAKLNDRHIFIFAVVATLASFTFFAMVPLPRAYYPEYFFHRPEEFFPAAFFIMSFIGIYRSQYLRKDPFTNWLLLSILIDIICQSLFMPLSGSLFDMEFDIAHLLKMLSYVIIIVGLLISVYRTFLETEEAKIVANTASETKSNFLAMMSHEIRTPMNGVLGIAQLLQKTDLNDDQKEKLDTLVSAGSAMVFILNDILDFSKIEKGKIALEETDFYIEENLTGLMAIFTETAAEQNTILNVHYNLPQDLALLGDITRIRQIIWNLLSNAIKFTNNGTVDLSIETVCSDSAEEVSDDTVVLQISVKDTGIGIAKDKQKSIFDAFHQADVSTTRLYGGTGLGLSIVTSLVGLMQGHIDLKSIEGVGSEFIVTLELHKGNTANIIIEKAQELIHERSPDFELPSDRPLNILLVEDQPLNAHIASEFIKHIGHNSTVAENGQVAVEAIKNSDYDLIIMDNHMPVMNGREATRAIRALEDKTKADIPIIGLTADAYQTAHKTLLASGMNDVLTKPIDVHTLEDSIQKHCVNNSGKEASPSGEAEGKIKENPEVKPDDPQKPDQAEELDLTSLNLMKSTLDEEQYIELIKETTDCIQQHCEDIDQALAQGGDKEKLRSLLHSLKGLSAQVGAKKLSRHVAETEMIAKTGLLNATHTDQLKEHVNLVCDILHQEQHSS